MEDAGVEVNGHAEAKHDERTEHVPRKAHAFKGQECHVLPEYVVNDIPKKVEYAKTEKPDWKKGGGKKQRNRMKPVKFKKENLLCHSVLSLKEGETAPPCKFPNCAYKHNVQEYLKSKPDDIGPECFCYRSLGKCNWGFTCRFGSDHLSEDFKNKVNEDNIPDKVQELNHLVKNIQISLRKKEYDFTEADEKVEKVFVFVKNRDGDCDSTRDECGEPAGKKAKVGNDTNEIMAHETGSKDHDTKAVENNGDVNMLSPDEPVSKKPKLDSNIKEVVRVPADENTANPDEPLNKKMKVDLKMSPGRIDQGNENGNNTMDDGEPVHKKVKLEEPAKIKTLGPVTDEDVIKVREVEKKRLDWEGKTYLAPLTTVGNLPFRRMCKRLGADITCGEMALGLPLLQGHGPEWALLQRHHSEDMFGIQVCGRSPPQMARVAQIINDNVECDFVDINMGCPIDLIYKKGMGSGLMVRKRALEVMVRSMSDILTCPLTVKMRKGVYNDKNIAHNLFPSLESWGAKALTIHGRSREQRYTRLADWDYIGQCAGTVNIPTFGNGDAMNFEDYNVMKEKSGVSGIMLARGALIKPWIFTEIREQRHWDISATERLDIVKEFCNYGLEHWGSDDKGVENTRKFLLEWLSFAHRYTPHGILMYPPQRINERLPIYRGRSELETLLSSPNSDDWVKISEMFLGKVRDDFSFAAKHKAKSYS